MRYRKHGHAPCAKRKILKKLLIIDDNVLVVNSLVRYYSKMGVFCQGLTSSEKVLQFLSKEPFDAVITDIHISPVNGFEIIRYVRAHWPDSLLIGMSAYCDEGYREHASDVGADFFFEKPFKLDEINDALKAHFPLAQGVP
jgi:two-component system response regulator (stage 0 sporulation protein F)